MSDISDKMISIAESIETQGDEMFVGLYGTRKAIERATKDIPLVKRTREFPAPFEFPELFCGIPVIERPSLPDNVILFGDKNGGAKELNLDTGVIKSMPPTIVKNG